MTTLTDSAEQFRAVTRRLLKCMVAYHRVEHFSAEGPTSRKGIALKALVAAQDDYVKADSQLTAQIERTKRLARAVRGGAA